MKKSLHLYIVDNINGVVTFTFGGRLHIATRHDDDRWYGKYYDFVSHSWNEVDVFDEDVVEELMKVLKE